MKKIAIRVDSSKIIGSGHLMRCLTLAGQLERNENAEIYFIARDLEGNLNALITDKGFKLKVLPRYAENSALIGYAKWLTVSQDTDSAETKDILSSLGSVDMIVIDSYAIDINWERAIRPFVKKIFVIDDLFNRRHDCDILLNQNFGFDFEKKYKGLVPPDCELRLGLKYLLLREEFYETKKSLRKRDGNIKNILVFYGGSDLTSETVKALQALAKLNLPNVTVNVVVGANNANKNLIEKYCFKHKFNFLCQVENMAELMNQADIAFGAGGSTTWERFFLGVPSIITSIAENQESDAIKYLNDEGYTIYMGNSADCTVQDLSQTVKNLTQEKIIQMQDKCLKLTS